MSYTDTVVMEWNALTLSRCESFPVALDDQDLVREYFLPFLLQRVENCVS